jgi:hypothetical protein
MKYLFLAFACVAGGCQFHLKGDDGGAGGDVDMSLPTDDGLGGGGGPDLAMGNDLVALPIICTVGSSSCNGSTLVTCPDGTTEVMTACPLGCSTTGGPHCNVIHPRAPVTTGDFDATGLVPVTLSASIYMSADNGQIGPTNMPLRQANNDANSYEVHQGIGFHQVAIPGATGKMGIYTFKTLKVNASVVVNTYGANAIAIVSAGDVTIDGELDVTCIGNYNVTVLLGAAHPWVAAPGGGAGGQPGVASVGFGTGGVGGVNADNAHAAGGGGGGYADTGGTGGSMGAASTGGAGGMAYGDAMLTTLVGGAGGGAGGQNGSLNMSYGGGGGGLALVVAMGTVTLGAGGSTGGVNVGGCGGTTNVGVGGGAGGSGGTILVQAVAVHVAANGALAANGGSGAAGNAAPGTATNGKTGTLGSAAATGGQTGGAADGGNGGAASTTSGTNGGSTTGAGGGAGGSVGRIRVESQSGSATVDSGGAVSPGAAQGTVDIH